MLFLCNIANVAQRTCERSFKNRDHTNIINYIDKRRTLPADSVYENGVVEVSLLHV